MFKFRTVHINSTSNSTMTLEAQDVLLNLGDSKNRLQLEFTSDMAMAAMIPNVAFLVLNGLFGHRFRTAPRLLVSLVMVVILFSITTALVMIDTDSWQETFLATTLGSVILINVFSATFQGGLIGMVGAFPPRYMKVMMMVMMIN